MSSTYYFSTQGCTLPSDGFSCCFSETPLAAAAAFLAFRSKKLAILEELAEASGGLGYRGRGEVGAEKSINASSRGARL